ncbi:hypothetical protein COB55_00795 [Candidatus Wolfebacteria bacterium]|nr:MAG: hypothetical protein COB55_00795 [Candidatus Wolfebacteria bacterium]
MNTCEIDWIRTRMQRVIAECTHNQVSDMNLEAVIRSEDVPKVLDATLKELGSDLNITIKSNGRTWTAEQLITYIYERQQKASCEV